MQLAEELRYLAERGENPTSGDLLAIAEALEELERSVDHQKNETAKVVARMKILEKMLEVTLKASSSSRTIDEMREQSKKICATDSPIFNAFEVRQLINTLDLSWSRFDLLKDAHNKLQAQTTAAMGLDQLLKEVDSGEARPFSYTDVLHLVQVYRAGNNLSRPMRNNVREVLQLLKAQPDAHFYGREVQMVRQWGSDHDRNLSIVKTRLGRAFTDPVGYMDTRSDLMLTKAQKRQLLDGRILAAQGFQHAVFARPDFLKIPDTWRIGHEGTQFHAGEHFHTDDLGRWWCGTQLQNMTAFEFMNFLETTLGELRLLYIHFPNGVTDETKQDPSTNGTDGTHQTRQRLERL